MQREVAKVYAAMDGIDAIVRATYPDTATMAAKLKEFARGGQPEGSKPAHSLAWVVKKAHDTLRSIEWQQNHVALNRAAGLDDDFEG
jgi:hypothetical protein